MNDRLNSTPPAETFFVIPLQWDDDPAAQLRRLRDETLRQQDFPGEATHAFMAAAWQSIGRLPADYFPPERAETLMHISRFHYLDGKTEREIEASAAAVKAAVRGGHRALEGRARARYGIGLRLAYDFVGSITELARAAEIAREEGDAMSEAKAMNSLGNSYNEAGLHHEALAIFERVAAFFEACGDARSAWMALDNAGAAALRLGDIDRGIGFVERAKTTWAGEALTADQKYWVIQGHFTCCQLLIQADRTDEAVEHARAATALAAAAGLGAGQELAEIAEVTATFAAGLVGTEAIERLIERSKEGPSYYSGALNAAIRTYEKIGRFDKALALQRELFAFNKERKFEQVHGLLGRYSPEEERETARLALLGSEVERKIADLVNAAINQALRAGHDHARIFRVSRLAEFFALSEGWPAKRAGRLALAAKLIDVGNLVIPNDLLSKPRELSEGERAIVIEHAQIGAELLASTHLALLEHCAPIVRFHHERWDGKGPGGLSGDNIPLEARVVALCDAFDALTHQRPWRQAFSVQAALRTMRGEAGKHFEPDLAHRFIDWIQDKLSDADDLDAFLGAEALENDYVMTRMRIDRLVKGATEPMLQA